MASDDVLSAARGRRIKRGNVELEWFGERAVASIDMTLEQRVKVATEYVRSRVVQNISTPVVKRQGPRGGTIVERSKKGEFPRSETQTLLRSIFAEVKIGRHIVDGLIGTPVDYGFILELSKELDRSFLLRTVMEEKGRVVKIMGKQMRDSRGRYLRAPEIER